MIQHRQLKVILRNKVSFHVLLVFICITSCGTSILGVSSQQTENKDFQEIVSYIVSGKGPSQDESIQTESQYTTNFQKNNPQQELQRTLHENIKDSKHIRVQGKSVQYSDQQIHNQQAYPKKDLHAFQQNLHKSDKGKPQENLLGNFQHLPQNNLQRFSNDKVSLGLSNNAQQEFHQDVKGAQQIVQPKLANHNQPTLLLNLQKRNRNKPQQKIRNEAQQRFNYNDQDISSKSVQISDRQTALQNIKNNNQQILPQALQKNIQQLLQQKLQNLGQESIQNNFQNSDQDSPHLYLQNNSPKTAKQKSENDPQQVFQENSLNYDNQIQKLHFQSRNNVNPIQNLPTTAKQIPQQNLYSNIVEIPLPNLQNNGQQEVPQQHLQSLSQQKIPQQYLQNNGQQQLPQQHLQNGHQTQVPQQHLRNYSRQLVLQQRLQTNGQQQVPQQYLQSSGQQHLQNNGQQQVPQLHLQNGDQQQEPQQYSKNSGQQQVPQQYLLNNGQQQVAQKYLQNSGEQQVPQQYLQNGGQQQILQQHLQNGGQQQILQQHLQNGGQQQILQQHLQNGGQQQILQQHLQNGGQQQIPKQHLQNGGQQQIPLQYLQNKTLLNVRYLGQHIPQLTENNLSQQNLQINGQYILYQYPQTHSNQGSQNINQQTPHQNSINNGLSTFQHNDQSRSQLILQNLAAQQVELHRDQHVPQQNTISGTQQFIKAQKHLPLQRTIQGQNYHEKANFASDITDPDEKRFVGERRTPKFYNLKNIDARPQLFPSTIQSFILPPIQTQEIIPVLASPTKVPNKVSNVKSRQETHQYYVEKLQDQLKKIYHQSPRGDIQRSSDELLPGGEKTHQGALLIGTAGGAAVEGFSRLPTQELHSRHPIRTTLRQHNNEEAGTSDTSDAAGHAINVNTGHLKDLVYSTSPAQPPLNIPISKININTDNLANKIFDNLQNHKHNLTLFLKNTGKVFQKDNLSQNLNSGEKTNVLNNIQKHAPFDSITIEPVDFIPDLPSPKQQLVEQLSNNPGTSDKITIHSDFNIEELLELLPGITESNPKLVNESSVFGFFDALMDGKKLSGEHFSNDKRLITFNNQKMLISKNPQKIATPKNVQQLLTSVSPFQGRKPEVFHKSLDKNPTKFNFSNVFVVHAKPDFSNKGSVIADIENRYLAQQPSGVRFIGNQYLRRNKTGFSNNLQSGFIKDIPKISQKEYSQQFTRNDTSKVSDFLNTRNNQNVQTGDSNSLFKTNLGNNQSAYFSRNQSFGDSNHLRFNSSTDAQNRFHSFADSRKKPLQQIPSKQSSSQNQRPSLQHNQPSSPFNQPYSPHNQPSSLYNQLSSSHNQQSSHNNQPSLQHKQYFTENKYTSSQNNQPSSKQSQLPSQHNQSSSTSDQSSTQHNQAPQENGNQSPYSNGIQVVKANLVTHYSVVEDATQ